MERDVNSGKYELVQNGKKLKLDETHFQPIFFADDVDELRDNLDAQKSLKKYRIFVGPDEFVEELKKDAIPTVDIATNLHEKIAQQRKEDEREFEKMTNLV